MTKSSDFKAVIGIVSVLLTFLGIVTANFEPTDNPPAGWQQTSSESTATKPLTKSEPSDSTNKTRSVSFERRLTDVQDSVADPSTPQQGFLAKVIGISDGDTCDVLTQDKRTIRLRWNAIDAPETGQPFGRNSKEWVSDRIGGKVVRVVEMDRDRYGRIVAEIYDSNGDSVNVGLVRAGLAWHYAYYAADRQDVAQAQDEARRQLRGLWAGSHRIVAPWDWRKLSKAERDLLR